MLLTLALVVLGSGPGERGAPGPLESLLDIGDPLSDGSSVYLFSTFDAGPAGSWAVRVWTDSPIGNTALVKDGAVVAIGGQPVGARGEVLDSVSLLDLSATGRLAWTGRIQPVLPVSPKSTVFIGSVPVLSAGDPVTAPLLAGSTIGGVAEVQRTESSAFVLGAIGAEPALLRLTPTTEGSLTQSPMLIGGGPLPDGRGTLQGIQQFAVNEAGTVLVDVLDDASTEWLFRDREPVLQSGLPVENLGLLDRIDWPDLNASGAWVAGGETVDAGGLRTNVLFKTGELYRATGDRLASIGGLPLDSVDPRASITDDGSVLWRGTWFAGPQLGTIQGLFLDDEALLVQYMTPVDDDVLQWIASAAISDDGKTVVILGGVKRGPAGPAPRLFRLQLP